MAIITQITSYMRTYSNTTIALLTLRTSNQELSGNIVADSISTIALDMTNGSSLVGAINTDNTAKEVTVKLSKDSTWTLTGDSYVKTLTNEDTTSSNIYLNGYTLVMDKKITTNPLKYNLFYTFTITKKKAQDN